MKGAANAIGGPIVRKDTAQQVVTAPVLIPDEPDRERHWYSRENIEEVATGFLPNGGGVDAMHLGGESGYPVESYLAPQELSFGQRTVPKGTWMVSMQVTDDEVWRGIETGQYAGVSVEGPPRSIYDDDGNELAIEDVAVPVGTQMNDRPPEPAVANSLGGGAELTIPPAPVGETWQIELERADFVSIVDDPAVQEATFVVAKRNGTQSGSGGSEPGEELTMDDETEEKFDELTSLVQKSVEASEEAKDTANEALEAAEEDGDGGDGGDGGNGGGGGGGNGGGSDNGGDDATTQAVQDLQSEVETLRSELNEGEEDDLDPETVDALVEQGVIDEEDAEEIKQSGGSTVEKRLYRIEKSLENGGGGRRGVGTQLDGEGGSNISSGGISSAMAGKGDGE